MLFGSLFSFFANKQLFFRGLENNFETLGSAQRLFLNMAFLGGIGLFFKKIVFSFPFSKRKKEKIVLSCFLFLRVVPFFLFIEKKGIAFFLKKKKERKKTRREFKKKKKRRGTFFGPQIFFFFLNCCSSVLVNSLLTSSSFFVCKRFFFFFLFFLLFLPVWEKKKENSDSLREKKK